MLPSEQQLKHTCGGYGEKIYIICQLKSIIGAGPLENGKPSS